MASEFFMKHKGGVTPYRIGADVLPGAGDLVRELTGAEKVAVISDETVAGFYLPTLETALKGAGLKVQSFVLRPGEATKALPVLQKLLDGLLEFGLKRRDAVVALGGGVIGDLAGFAASVLLRGVPFINIPTTVLAQVDSAIGGKTAINTRFGKNMVGTITQPAAVLSDVSLLTTLEAREFRAGYAEMVKHAILDGDEAFQALEDGFEAFFAKDPAVLASEIHRSAKIKAAFVEADEQDHGQRQLLNLGHTFGHALEALAGYDGTLNHGEAVSIGMCLAFQYAENAGMISEGPGARVKAHLEKAGLPTTLEGAEVGAGAAALLDYMRRDKKAGSEILLVLPKAFGDVIYTPVEEADLAAFLEAL